MFIVPVIKFIAVLSYTIFTGAAVYVSLVEHPARMGLDTKAAATEWAPSYKRGKVMPGFLGYTQFLYRRIGFVVRWRHHMAGRRNCNRLSGAVHPSHHLAHQPST